MRREDYAIQQFEKGYNCAQSVLSAFHDVLETNENELLKISSGFGGGMGHMQLTCGAVTGSFLVISMKYGSSDPENKHAKETTYNKIQDFHNRFKKLNKSSDCMELLGHELDTIEGKKNIYENNLFEKVCHKAIIDAVNILNKLINC